MATVTSVVTIDADEWVYPGVDGITHTVTATETFNLTIENTASAIKWEVLPGETLATTDGYTLTFRPLNDANNVSYGLDLMALADTVTTPSLLGELRMSCSDTEIVQIWKPASFTTSNVDMNAAGTIGATATIWEDQFGHTMTIPGTGSGINADTAA